METRQIRADEVESGMIVVDQTLDSSPLLRKVQTVTSDRFTAICYEDGTSEVVARYIPIAVRVAEPELV